MRKQGEVSNYPPGSRLNQVRLTTTAAAKLVASPVLGRQYMRSMRLRELSLCSRHASGRSPALRPLFRVVGSVFVCRLPPADAIGAFLGANERQRVLRDHQFFVGRADPDQDVAVRGGTQATLRREARVPRPRL